MFVIVDNAEPLHFEDSVSVTKSIDIITLLMR